MQPRFPLYIPSKSRADSRFTMKALDAMGVPYHVVVEPQQLDDYARVIDRSKLLALDMSYKERYELMDEFGLTQSTGSGPARNFIWDHAVSQGAEYHWIMDDNIRDFFRLNRNQKIRVGDGVFFRCMEDFVLRYTNIAMAGPAYEFFAPKRQKLPPFIPNTRIYSCNLIRCDVPFRWRCRYNEDTDLSLRMLKAGWCTVQFNAFLQNKIATLMIKGGNTEELYRGGEMNKAKSEMIARLHPDVARVVWKFGRWHHHVDYRPFARNRLVRRSDVGQVNDYGMRLVTIEGK